MAAGRVVLLVLLAVVAVARPVRAQDDLRHDFQVWLPATVRGAPIDDTFGGYFEVQPRFGDHASELVQLRVRPALYARFLDRDLELFLGYAWAPWFNPFRDEHRIWEQVEYRHGAGDLVVLEHQLRVEQRFIENTPDVAVRIRYTLRGELPLDDEKVFSLTAYEQIYFNLNTVWRGPEAGLDQNRVFLGVTLRPEKWVWFDLGYLNRYGTDNTASNTPSGRGRESITHILLAQVNFTF